MSSSMIRSALTLAALFAFALSPNPASAQSWLYVTLIPYGGGTSTLLELPLTPEGIGGLQRQVTLPGTPGPPVVTADGRYVAFTLTAASAASSQLAVFDRRSGAVTVIPGVVRPIGFYRGAGPVPDPTALRLFFFDETLITVIEPAGVRTVPIPAIDVAVIPQLSADGRDLFVARYTPVGPGAGRVYHIAVLDPLTGAERRSLPELPQGRLSSMALSRDGQRLFVTMNEPLAVRVLDAMSGAELLSRGGLIDPPVGIEFLGHIYADDRHNRLFVGSVQATHSAPLSTLRILDASTLQVIGSGGTGSSSVGIDNTLGMVIATSTIDNQYHRCVNVGVNVWGASPAPMASFNASLGMQCPAIAIASPPDAPADLTPTLNGSGVTFNWSGVPGATGYAIEAGSTSGSSNLARIETDQPTFVVAGVPPRTYHVRVRALNDVGPSAASNEIVVTVP